MVISVGGMIVQTVINGFGVVLSAGFTARISCTDCWRRQQPPYGCDVDLCGIWAPGEKTGFHRMRAVCYFTVTSLVITVHDARAWPQILSLFIADLAKNGGEVPRCVPVSENHDVQFCMCACDAQRCIGAWK